MYSMFEYLLDSKTKRRINFFMPALETCLWKDYSSLRYREGERMDCDRDTDFKKWEEERFREFGKELKSWQIEEPGLGADTIAGDVA